MVIRPATSADVDSMVSLMFVEPAREAVVLGGGVERARRFQRELLQAAFAQEGSRAHVAVDDGSIVGFALASVDGSDAHPRHRGRGTGGALLDTVEAAARSWGAPLLSLTTASSNPARRLYERHDFSVVRERRGRRYTRLTGLPGRVRMVKPLRAGP